MQSIMVIMDIANSVVGHHFRKCLAVLHTERGQGAGGGPLYRATAYDQAALICLNSSKR